MRPHGAGTVSLARGRYRAQLVVDGRRRSLGSYATREEAEAILDGARAELAASDAHATRDGVDLGTWVARVLDRREAHGLRGVDRERSRWSVHVAPSDLARLQVRRITRADVQRWLDRLLASRARGARGGARPIGRQTASNALTLLRAVLEDAVARGVAAENAARDVRLPRARGRTAETWTYLEPEEQARLLRAVTAHARPAVAFALVAGVRQGEQWALRLDDVHHDEDAPHVTIRYVSVLEAMLDQAGEEQEATG